MAELKRKEALEYLKIPEKHFDNYIKNSKEYQQQLIKILKLIPSQIVKQDAVYAPTWVTHYLHSTLDMIEKESFESINII